MVDLVQYMWVCFLARKRALKGEGIFYCGIENHGVVQCAVFVAFGRSAWRVTQRAIEETR